MKKTRKLFSRLVSFCLCLTIAAGISVPVAAAPPTETGAAQNASITVNKVLEVKDGKFPSVDTDFTFNIAAGKQFKLDGTAVAGTTGIPMPQSARSVGALAVIEASSAAMEGNANAKTAAATFGNIDFSTSSTGIYVYSITETVGTVPGMSYDSSPRLVVVYVTNLVDSNDNIILDDAGKPVPTVSQINIWKGVSLDDMTFDKVTTNAPLNPDADGKIATSDPTITDNTRKVGYTLKNNYAAAGVTIKTDIKGSAADTDKTYTYTLDLKNGTADDTTKYSYTIYDKKGTPVEGKTGTITDNGTFTLGNGEYIVIDLPVGENYTVTGPAIESGYTGTITGKAGATEINETGKTTVGEKAVSDPSVSGNDNTQTFTYTKGMVPPTGVMLEILPYVLVVLLAGAGFAVVLRKRKTEQE